MKKIKLFALAMLISTAGLFASELESSNMKKDEMRTQILELLKTPNFEVSTDIKFTIKFTFNSERELIVLGVDTKNSKVLNYIRKNLNYKKIENPGKRNEIYHLPLKFTAV